MHVNPGSIEKINFIFQHGWGFSGNCWQGWQNFLPGANCQFLDRGYWGSKTSDIKFSAGLNVLICHSLGLHFIMDQELSGLDLLVVLNGFVHFHGVNKAQGLFTRKHVQRMKKRLDADPGGLLQDFYRDCSCRQTEIAISSLDKKLLLDDLEMLNTSFLKNEEIKKIPDKLLMHGAEDRIVPLDRAQHLNKFLGGDLRTVEGAGHGLPFTHQDLIVKGIIERLS